MDYFNLIPSELNNIIISYISFTDLKSLLNTFSLPNLNWSVIHDYHFNEYKSISLSDYLNKLSTESLINKLNLNYSIDELLNSNTFNLNDIGLTEIPPEIFNLNNLQYLSFEYNRITDVPLGISNLTNLIKLELTNNLLVEIPPGIFKLINLRELHLNRNYIKQVPPEIGTLSNLRYLDLSSNQIVKINPEIGKLANLIRLNFNFNYHLEQIPVEIGKLPRLIRLDLHGSKIKSIDQLPVEVRKVLMINL